MAKYGLTQRTVEVRARKIDKVVSSMLIRLYNQIFKDLPVAVQVGGRNDYRETVSHIRHHQHCLKKIAMYSHTEDSADAELRSLFVYSYQQSRAYYGRHSKFPFKKGDVEILASVYQFLSLLEGIGSQAEQALQSGSSRVDDVQKATRAQIIAVIATYLPALYEETQRC